MLLNTVKDFIASIPQFVPNLLYNMSEEKVANDIAISEAEKNRQFQQNSALQAMNFEREQADLAYERQKELRSTEIIDAYNQLKGLGINPELAYGSLTGVSTGAPATGSGYSASGSSPSIRSSKAFSTITTIVNSGIQAVAKIAGASMAT